MGRFWRGALAALVMVAVVLPIPAGVGTHLGFMLWPELTTLLVKTLVGAVAYIGTLGLCWWLSGQPRPSAEGHILEWGAAALRRLRRPGAAALPS